MARDTTGAFSLIGIFRDLFDTTSKTLYVSDPGLTAAMGDIPGTTTVNKFGRNTVIASGVTADIWDGGKTVGALPAGSTLLWTAPTAAATHNIASTSASDDGAPAGVGAQTVKIYGLTDWDTAEISETVILNGTTNVVTANPYVIIHRMEVTAWGATNINVGTITATAIAPSATTVTARIEVGQGQTQMAVYGIPSAQTFYMNLFYASVNKAGGAAGIMDMSIKFNPDPGTEATNFITKHTMGIETDGAGVHDHHYHTPKVFPGPGIVKIQVLSGTNGNDISAGFDGCLVNN